MKKQMIAGIALAMGILSVGTFTASAEEACCGNGKCADKHTVHQFTQETASLSSALKAKDIELRDLYGQDRVDMRKVDALEAEIKELKGNLAVAAEKHGIMACCVS